MVDCLYIHIPFCRKKCNYCSFVSIPQTDLIDEYINALILQIKTQYKNEKLRTVYFGGGTPSLLKIELFAKIFELLNFDKETEVTLEANPCDISFDYLNNLKQMGVNRLSLGVQTFDDEILKLIGRRHNAQTAKQAIATAKDVGFENISIDLIYGLPNQNCENYEKTLLTALEQDVQHLSFYGLKIDEGCYFFEHKPKNIADDEAQAKMYKLTKDILEKKGYIHYEISNFAKKGFESKHNTNYWKANPYYGFGAAAHGWDGTIRYENHSNVFEYIKNPITYQNTHLLSDAEKLEETIFLGFRLLNGINTEEINSRFNIDFEKKYKKILEKYQQYNHLIKTGNGYKLTFEGVLLSNYILSEFIDLD